MTRRSALAAALAAALVLLPAPARAAAADTLTVVTLNLWNDQHGWPARLRRIVAELRAIRPDVLCLQEVLQNPSLPNQAATLADSLGMSWHFASVDDSTRAKRYGNAILARHPVLRTDDVKLRPLDDWRVATHVRIAFAGRAVDVYDTHLHHTREGGAIRAAQVRDLLAFVDSTRGDGQLVLAGDFNAQAGAPELRPLASRYADAWWVVHPRATPDEAATLNPLLGESRGQIDHVFVPRGRGRALAPAACEVLFRSCGPDSVWASDHFGVLARLVPRPAPAPRDRAR